MHYLHLRLLRQFNCWPSIDSRILQEKLIIVNAVVASN